MKTHQKRLLGLIVLAVVVSAGVMLKFEPASEQLGIAPNHSTKDSPIEKNILESFRTGTASALLPYLKGTVNVSIIEEENIFSAKETLGALQQFFDKNPPKSMIKKHSGITKSGEGQYLIGVLTTAEGAQYRCHFFIDSQKISSIEIRLERKLE